MTNLRHLIGDDHFATLTAKLGGRTIAVPSFLGRRPHGGKFAGEPLIRDVGEPLAVLLSFHFGGSTLYVPKPKDQPANLALLKRLIRRPNMTARAIASRTGCTIRTVEKHRAKVRAQSKGTVK